MIVLEPTPPRAYFDDTLIAWNVFTARRSGVCATVEPDPLGPVNQIVRICRVEGDRRVSVKAALVPISAGATVTLHRDQITWTLSEITKLRENRWNERKYALRATPTQPGWRVDVDGQTVLRASDSDIRPLPPQPRVPMRQRCAQAAQRACSERLRRLGDAIAGRFGYVRDEGDRW